LRRDQAVFEIGENLRIYRDAPAEHEAKISQSEGIEDKHAEHQKYEQGLESVNTGWKMQHHEAFARFLVVIFELSNLAYQAANRHRTIFFKRRECRDFNALLLKSRQLRGYWVRAPECQIIYAP